MFHHRSTHGPVDLAFTDRYGGVSAVPYDELNLALDDGDDPAARAENLRRVVAEFAPGATVAQVRQVTVRFSEPVVPLGDLRLPDPVSVQCTGPAPAGTGRWIDDRAWVYDFRETLPPGFQRSEFLLEKGMVDRVVHRKELRQTLGSILGTLMMGRARAA